jgi:Holliday junction resolvase-like predicted endonuclease
MLVFVEVKVIDKIDDLHDYVTKKKLQFLKKAIAKYLYEHKLVDQEIQLDVVFVKNKIVVEIFHNVTNT